MAGMLKRIGAWFVRPSAKIGQGLLLMFGVFLGVILWGGFNTAMEASNRMDFCISCHEMRDTVYEEYKTSVHYNNPSGVRATCSDCHVPHEWGPKVVRKIRATNELWHKMIGSISTPEKFEAKRLELATHVWEAMKANDSRECRNCHSFEAMDFEHQTRRAREKMEPVAMGTDLSQGTTCIDCHKGVAHKMPRIERDD